MDSIGPNQHPDAVTEVGQRLGQGLAVLATLGEAAARLAAEEMRRAERRDERASSVLAARGADHLAQRAASRRAARHDRRIIAQTLDPDWLARADLLDLATVWRAARVREREFPEARVAADQVEERLRETYPRPMDLYDQAVAGGASRAAAMRAAAQQMAHTRPARPHGGRRSPAVEPGPELVAGAAGFDTAIRQERTRLADGAAYVEELERLGAGGAAAAQALREVLAARAGQELRQSQADAATLDDPTTVGVDERATIGLPRNARDIGAARTAAQLAAEWYPEGMSRPGALPAHVANRQPANTRTQTPNSTRSPVRTR